MPEIDSSRQGFDWIAAGRKHATEEHRSDSGEGDYDLMIPGKISELRSYLRWEEPMMGINGEGRVRHLHRAASLQSRLLVRMANPFLPTTFSKRPAVWNAVETMDNSQST